MKKDDQQPATKKDLRGLKKDFRRLEASTKKDIRQLRLEMATKNDLLELKKEMVHEFKVIAENITHDYKGIFKDRLEQHEDSIIALKLHAGLAA